MYALPRWRPYCIRALAGRAIDDADEDCKPVGPDVLGWKEEGATWLLHQNDNTAVFGQLTEAIAKNSSDQQIATLIKEHGAEV